MPSNMFGDGGYVADGNGYELTFSLPWKCLAKTHSKDFLIDYWLNSIINHHVFWSCLKPTIVIDPLCN